MRALLVAALVLGLGCGGGHGGTMVSFCLNFTGAQAPAAGRVVARLASGGSCAARFVEIVVTDVADVFSGSFTVNFDPTKVAFGSASFQGSFLTAGGVQVNVVQTNPQPGSVTVGISRFGVASGVDVIGSQVLVRLSFAPVGAGAATLTLANGQLFDSGTPPQPKSGLTWSGGTFQVQ